jgi:hypothetical protein
MFGILGVTRVLAADGTDVALGGPRRKALLAMPTLEAGRVVPTERLVDGLYGQEPPTGVGNAVQSQVSRLRQVLPVPVERHPVGYRLVADPDQVDAHRFERLGAEGRDALAGQGPSRGRGRYRAGRPAAPPGRCGRRRGRGWPRFAGGRTPHRGRAPRCLYGAVRPADGPDAAAATARARGALGDAAYEEAAAATAGLPREEAVGVLSRYLTRG